MKQLLQIAIDGPVAAGKGTIATNLSKKTQARYVDSGAMYRAVGLFGIRNDISLDDPQHLLSELKNTDVSLKPSKTNSNAFDVYVGDENVMDKIRTLEVDKASSVVAQYPKIRSYLVEKQKEIAKKYSVIMEGRDIGTVVMPEANIKIFLTADQSTRAKRRQMQLAEKGENVEFEKVLEETIERDNRDMSRNASPLVKASDAVEVDTSNMSIDQVVDTLVEIIQKKNDSN